MKDIYTLAAIAILAALYRFSDEESVLPSVAKTQSTIESDNRIDRIQSSSNNSNFAKLSDPISDLSPADIDEIFDRSNGLAYQSIEQLDYDPDLMKQIREDLENFRKFGSVSKGVPTIEFGSTDRLSKALSEKGLNTILSGLAFNPVHLTNILESNYRLVGADDQGKLIPERGWNGYLQSLSDSSGRQVELSESQIETKLGDGADIIKEFLNDTVRGVPVSIQTMSDLAGHEIFSIQWSDADRLFTLNTKSFERSEATALAEKILVRYRNLPNQGWKTPYVLDPNNPFHRMALQRDLQRIKK